MEVRITIDVDWESGDYDIPALRSDDWPQAAISITAALMFVGFELSVFIIGLWSATFYPLLGDGRPYHNRTRSRHHDSRTSRAPFTGNVATLTNPLDYSLDQSNPTDYSVLMDVPGHTIIETQGFLASTKGRMSAEEVTALTELLSKNPEAGDVMQGTGGMRKLRFATQGRGKSGSVRVVYYYYNVSVPLFLLRVYAKNEKANLTKAERNALGGLGKILVETYGARK